MPQRSIIRNRSILVADDDPFYREVAAAALAASGYKIVQVVNGEDCLARLASESIDLLLLDLTMPLVGGLDILRKIRGNQATAHLPVIVVTGSQDHATIEEAYLAGATSFLAKPINWSLLPHYVDYVMRTSVTESSLRDAVRTADFLSRLKTSFVSVLTRELGKPMRAVRNCVSLLKAEGSITSELEAASEALDRSMLKMLHMGSLIASEAPLQEKRVSLEPLIRDAIDSCVAVADGKGIRLVVELSFGTSVDIVCEPALVSQAIRSLIENALTFSAVGAEVTVRARINDSSGFSLTVEDNAPSLPKETIRRLFDRPSDAAGNAATATSNRDVGLSVSRILAEAHQGTLGINPARDSGNTAILALPATRIIHSRPVSHSSSVH